MGGDLSTEDVQHTLSTGATGRDVALLAQHLVLVGYSVRPHASHDDWATHRSDGRDRAGKSQRSRATQLGRRSSAGCPTHRSDRGVVRSHARAGAGRLRWWYCRQRTASGCRIRILGSVKQVGGLLATEVGNSTNGATDTKASGERVDQSVDVLGGAKILIGQAQQQGFLPQFCTAFSRTANGKTSCATLEQFQTTAARGNPYTHWSWSTHALEHTTSQQELRQCLEQGIGN